MHEGTALLGNDKEVVVQGLKPIILVVVSPA
jgi:hypothetical protein